MADETATWVGVAPGTFDTVTNWSPEPAEIGDGDTLTCNRDHTQNIAGGDFSGTKLTAFKTERGSTIDVGGDGNPLIVDSALFVHRGTGTLWLKSDDAASTFFTDLVIIDSPNTILAASLDGEQMDIINALGGRTVLEPTLGTVAVPSVLVVGSQVNPMGNPIVSISEKSGGITDPMVDAATQFSGRVECAGVVTRVDMIGGVWVQDGLQKIVTLNMYGGMVLYGAESSFGTITTVNLYAGTLDTTHLAKQVTITTLNLFGGTLLRDPDLLTITNENHYGGKIVDQLAVVDQRSVQLIGGGTGVR